MKHSKRFCRWLLCTLLCLSSLLIHLSEYRLSTLGQFLFCSLQLIYIAVDEDSSGRLLSQELVRRLGSDRCRLVHFGPECKDANEHLIKYGAESLLITLEQAEEIPLEGVFTAEDRQEPLRTLFENGLQRGAETGWDNLDENCTFETGRLLPLIHI